MKKGYIITLNSPLSMLNKKARNAIKKGEKWLDYRPGTLDELRNLHWNPSYLPLRQPEDMLILVALFNDVPVSAVAVTLNPEKLKIVYKYSGNDPNWKQLQGNAFLLWKIVETFQDTQEYDYLDLGGGSQRKPHITAFKRRMSTGSYDQEAQKRSIFTRLNYRIMKWLPNHIADLWRGSSDAPYYTVLNYHEITPELFHEHIIYLKNVYNLCDLSLLRDHYINNTPLPDNPCFITFDDGWRSNFDLLPIIKEKDVPVTIFLATGYTGTLDSPGTRHKKTSSRVMLNNDEIIKMSGVVNFQSHGVTHSQASALNADEFLAELKDSKHFIEGLTGKDVYAFAYPYNNSQYVKLVKDAGYDLSRIGGRTLNTNKQNKYLINSIGVGENWSYYQLSYALLKAKIKTWRNRF